MINLTQEMKTIEAYILSQPNHVLINACAGSGKTTFLAYLLNNVLKSFQIMALAYGKDAASELLSRAPKANVMTHHNLGMQLCRTNLVKIPKKDRFADVDDVKNWKTWNMLGKLLTKEQRESKRKWIKSIDLIHGYFKNMAICNPKVGDVEEVFNSTLVPTSQRKNIGGDDLDEFFNLTLTTFAKSINSRDKFNRIECNFDDMIFWPVYNKWAVPKVDYLLIDEVQDYNPIQIEVAAMFASQGTRIIAVGDRRQAIYGWRGAIKAMDRLKERLDEI